MMISAEWIEQATRRIAPRIQKKTLQHDVEQGVFLKTVPLAVAPFGRRAHRLAVVVISGGNIDLDLHQAILQEHP